MILILSTYSLLKLQETASNSDSKVVSRQVADYFDQDFIFNQDKGSNGLQIAFGLTHYPAESNEMTHEPEYGELKVSY